MAAGRWGRALGAGRTALGASTSVADPAACGVRHPLRHGIYFLQVLPATTVSGSDDERSVAGLGDRRDLLGMDRRDAALVAGCMAGMTLMLVLASLATRYLTGFADVFPGMPDNLYNLLMAFGYAGLAVIAYWRLEALQYQAVAGAALGASIAFVALLASATLLSNPLLAVLGEALYALVYVLVSFLFALALLRLPSLKAATVAVIGGVIARQLALPLYSAPLEPVVGIVVMGIVAAVAILVLAFLVKPLFGPFANRETLALLELTNPLSSLRPPARLFVVALLVQLTYSFSNHLGVPGLSARRLIVVLALLVLLWLLLVQRDGQEDRLFSLVALFIMAGLLIAPLVLGGDTFAAHTCLFLGSASFSILLWLLVYGLGVRNVAAMAPVFGLLMALYTLGGFVGGALGSATIGSADMPLAQTQAVILGLAFAFFAFVWLAIRDFSFSEAIRGVETTDQLEVVAGEVEAAGSGVPEVAASGEAPGGVGTSADDESGGDGSAAAFESRGESSGKGRRPSPREARLRELAAQAQLTPREVEIFELLAQGRNAQYLMDTLHITRNTAKAHISHIYTKLGVHSHQDLLSLVEGGA